MAKKETTSNVRSYSLGFYVLRTTGLDKEPLLKFMHDNILDQSKDVSALPTTKMKA